MEYLNVQEKWVNGKGQRNTVKITRGKAIKKVETLGAKGRVLRSKTRKLKAAEKQAILKGTFVPGLWNNCRFGTCTRRRSQKGSGLLNTILCRGAKCAETPGANQSKVNPLTQPLVSSEPENIHTLVRRDYKRMENEHKNYDVIVNELATTHGIAPSTVEYYISEQTPAEKQMVANALAHARAQNKTTRQQLVRTMANARTLERQQQRQTKILGTAWSTTPEQEAAMLAELDASSGIQNWH
jgi:hypothetical protein